MEFVLLCDESAEKGKKYGDFFGGCIVDGRDITAINEALNHEKIDLHFFPICLRSCRNNRTYPGKAK